MGTFRCFLKNSKPITANSYYLTVQEKDIDLMNADCIPLVEEDHSVSYSSLTGGGYKSSNNHKKYIGVNGNDVTDLAASSTVIVPGAEWKCSRCDRFNDADYQFCGYCSLKRLSVVEEAPFEPSNSDDLAMHNKQTPFSPQPGSKWHKNKNEESPTRPSMNAPKPMLSETNTEKKSKHKKNTI